MELTRIPMNDYPDDWSAVATAVKTDAGNRCAACGHPHETPTNRVSCDELCGHEADDRQRILTVHHLDGDKANCRWWNLVPLCQVCHLRVQGRLHPDQGFLCAPPEWLQPYLAGRYAWNVLGLELDRFEVQVVIPEVLAMVNPSLYDELMGVQEAVLA